jgi:hypothetical protein
LHLSNLTRNSSKLERGGFANLDKLYASPALPADVLAVKDRAYSNMRLWISCLHYGAGMWADAARNLAEAMALSPDLRDPLNLLHTLCWAALSPRVPQPVSFIRDVLDHLPVNADVMLSQSLRARALSRVHLGTALRYYSAQDIPQAPHHVNIAVELYPELLRQRRDFEELLIQFAMQLPGRSPIGFVRDVIRNLPEAAQALAAVEPRVLSHVHAAYAFEKYSARERTTVPTHVLNAIRYQPSVLRNRGVWSIFTRSLWANASGRAAS